MKWMVLIVAMLLSVGCGGSTGDSDETTNDTPSNNMTGDDMDPTGTPPDDTPSNNMTPSNNEPDPGDPGDTPGVPDGPDPSEIELDTLIEDVVAAVCGSLTRCCSSQDMATYFNPIINHGRLEDAGLSIPEDEAECLTTLTQAFEVLPLGPWVKAAQEGLVEWHPEAAAECFGDLAAASCGSEMQAALLDSTCFGFQPPFRQKRAMFTRTDTVGATCNVLSDGVGGTFFGTCDPETSFCCVDNGNGCVPSPPGSQGVCKAASDVGDTCTLVPTQICRTGLDCSIDGVCEPAIDTPLTQGDTCAEGNRLLGRCTDGWCDLLGSRQCEPYKERGETCQGGEECDTGYCDAGACGDWGFCQSNEPGPDPDPEPGPDPDPEPGPDPDPEPGDGGAGESCEDASSLTASSETVETPANRYDRRVSGGWGAQNDYNPLESSGQAPGCALAFDAIGNEVVYSVTLEPGDTLFTKLTLEPAAAIPAIYLVDGCPVGGWPDIDGSGRCGNNEYVTEGFCLGNNCAPLEWSFTWPETLNGEPTETRTFYLVLDEVAGARAEAHTLEWTIAR